MSSSSSKRKKGSLAASIDRLVDSRMNSSIAKTKIDLMVARGQRYTDRSESEREKNRRECSLLDSMNLKIQLENCENAMRVLRQSLADARDEGDEEEIHLLKMQIRRMRAKILTMNNID